MRLRVLGRFERNLALSAAVLLIGGFTAGCSSDTARFGDGLTTGSTNVRPPVVVPPGNQPYPGDTLAPAASSGIATDSAPQPSYRSSGIQHSELAPVTTSRSARLDDRRAASPLPPVRSARLDDTVTGTAERHREPERMAAKGWSRDGGTPVTVRPGETVNDLARRYSVPAKAIMAANGLTSSGALAAGQKIVIPVYGSSARVADAGSLHAQADLPGRDAPAPHKSAQAHVAILPQSPKLKGRDARNAGALNTASAETPPAKAEKIAEAKAERAAEKPRQSAAGGGYTVKAGDTLFSVAKKHGVTAEAIKEANALKSGVLHIGQTLVIPEAGATRVAKAEDKDVDPVVTGTPGPSKPKSADASGTADAKPAAYTPPQKTSKVIADAEADEKVAAPDSTGLSKMRWPVRGRIIAGFGRSGGASNDGIDISVPEGTPVKAAENGVVIYAGSGLKDFGNTVLIRHEDGLVTVYGHASKLEVTRGEKVTRGQEIALSGMSGTTASPRLHFEVRKNSAPVDPSKFLE